MPTGMLRNSKIQKVRQSWAGAGAGAGRVVYAEMRMLRPSRTRPEVDATVSYLRNLRRGSSEDVGSSMAAAQRRERL
eukprot:764613-Hanusia_phi.AAC.2